MSSTMDDNDNIGDLRDEALYRALAHAPDHSAVPNWRVRKAIVEHAHDAVTPFAADAAEEAPQSWWRRLLGIGGGSRMPWNAAFATVLVAVLVTVLWQREPVPGARPDSEAPAAVAPAAPGAPAPSREAAAPAAPAPAPAPTPAQPPASAESELWPSKLVPSLTPETPAPVPPPPVASEAPQASGRRAPAPDEAKEARKQEASPALERVPVPPRPVPPAAPSADTLGRMAPGEASAEKRRLEEDSASRQRAAPQAAAPAPMTPAGPPAGGAAAPAAAAEAGAPPSFAALSQWSRLTITPRGGASRTLSRSEALDLHALLGSAAISAVGSQPLAGAPEWRVTLERGNGDVMATFELGRNQVRWREGRGPGTTGAPSADALAALRDALQRAVETPAQPPQLQWKPTQPPADAGTAPPAPSR